MRFLTLGAVDLRAPGGDELRAVLVQPKRLALLAYLSLANPPGLHRRDRLFALFWPDSDVEQARRSLRQSLHFLRQSLGANVIISRGDEEVGINFDAIACDAREFERALDRGRPDDALTLYRGTLLDGFHVSGVAAEFDQWLDEERARLRGRAVEAAAALRDAALQAGNGDLAVKHARDALRFDPLNEGNLRHLMLSLDRAGDHAAAVRAYQDFSNRLQADLGVAPSPETAKLADRPTQGRPAEAVERSAKNTEPPALDLAAIRDNTNRRSRFRLLLIAPLVLAAIAIAIVAALRGSNAPASVSEVVLAIGAIDDETGPDSLGTSRIFRDLVTTELARIPGLTVLSEARIQQLLAQIGAANETRATITEAARRAGAHEILDGTLYRRGPNELRLDLRRADIASGVIRRAYAAEGSDVFALVSRLSELFSAEVGSTAPTPGLEELTTKSLVARGFYEEGLRAYYQSDGHGAMRLFRAALAEDSTFAMAAYLAARTLAAIGDTGRMHYAALAARHAHRATERERLLIAAGWAELSNSPNLVPIAESLAQRFPLEPEAQLTLGRARAWSGDLVRPIADFRRAIALDSLSLVGLPRQTISQRPQCVACDAFEELVFTYTRVDSLQAAEQVAREWTRHHPKSYVAWSALSAVLDAQGRTPEAENAHNTARSLVNEPPDDTWVRARMALRAGNFLAADSLLAQRAASDLLQVRRDAFWWQVISLRTQGRLRAALVAASRYLDAHGGAEEPTTFVPMGQVLFEMGKAREAAEYFETAANRGQIGHTPGTPARALGLVARDQVWNLTHAAVAYSAARDTTRLARLADSVRFLGQLEAFGRDRRLHHHLRGLLWLHRGQPAQGAAAFREALGSPTVGYSRTNLEYGRVLISLRRHREAAAILAAALRGDLQASNYYATQTELHEMLAQALEGAGQRDSARVHFAWVAKAWRHADPEFASRAAQALVKSRP